MKGPSLRTERLQLRPIRKGDLPRLCALFSSPEMMRHLPFPAASIPTRMRRLVRKIVGDPARCRGFSVLKGKRWIGVVTLFIEEEGVGEIGYSLSPDCWGKGYVTEASSALMGWAFATLGLRRIGAACMDSNRRSIAVARRLGMRREGRHRHWWVKDGVVSDRLLYGITRTEWTTSQVERLKRTAKQRR